MGRYRRQSGACSLGRISGGRLPRNAEESAREHPFRTARPGARTGFGGQDPLHEHAGYRRLAGLRIYCI